MGKIRTLIEGEEWDASLKKCVIAHPSKWDDAFRAAAWNIAAKPYLNTTPFLSERERIMEIDFPGVTTLWVYFRVEDDDNACTLLWIESEGEHARVLLRVG